MYDYGRLVFLDNQKTGSTYVSKFLESCCTLDRVRHRRPTKHLPVRKRYNPDSLYFATVREPFALYDSLFRYGQDEKGITWKRLRNRKLGSLYDNFSTWLEYVLDPENAPIFDREYNRFAGYGIGIMSFRAMRITVQYPVKNLTPVKTYDGIVQKWKEHCIADHIFKQENLNTSLAEFATKTVPAYFDQDKVKTFLNQSERVNVTGVKVQLEFPPSLRKVIEDKERFLLDEYYSTNI